MDRRAVMVVLAAVVVIELGASIYTRCQLADLNRGLHRMCEVDSGLDACRREHRSGGCDHLVLPACRAYFGPDWATENR